MAEAGLSPFPLWGPWVLLNLGCCDRASVWWVPRTAGSVGRRGRQCRCRKSTRSAGESGAEPPRRQRCFLASVTSEALSWVILHPTSCSDPSLFASPVCPLVLAGHGADSRLWWADDTLISVASPAPQSPDYSVLCAPLAVSYLSFPRGFMHVPELSVSTTPLPPRPLALVLEWSAHSQCSSLSLYLMKVKVFTCLCLLMFTEKWTVCNVSLFMFSMCF